MLETTARISGRECIVEVANARWPTPAEYAWKNDAAVLTMIFGRRSYPVQGRYTEMQDSRMASVGSVFLIPPGRELYGRGPGGEHGVVRCFFNADVNDAILERMSRLTGRQLDRSLNISSSTVTTLMRRLLVEASRPRFASAELIDSIGSVLLIECGYRIFGHQYGDEAPLRVGGDYLDLVDEFLGKTDYATVPTVKQLAYLCGFSTSHFAKTFLRDTGQTIGRYLAEARIRRAENLLAHTNLPLKEIASQLGYANPANFSASFTRTMQLTPGKYRRRVRNGSLKSA